MLFYWLSRYSNARYNCTTKCNKKRRLKVIVKVFNYPFTKNGRQTKCWLYSIRSANRLYVFYDWSSMQCKYDNNYRFRHGLIVTQQNKQCTTWPHSCTNVNCRYRHRSTAVNAEKSTQFSPPNSITMPLSSSFQKQD